MKRNFGSIVLTVSAAVMVLASCASSQHVDTSQIPDWVKNQPTSKDTFYGIGIAKMSDLNLSRETAIARARNEVAQDVALRVKTALTDYQQQAGSADKQQALNFTETVSRQIADVTLKGSVVEKTVIADDGTVYALVSYPVASVLASAGQTFKRNEAASYAEFKANDALKQLNQELQNSPPKTGVLDH